MISIASKKTNGKTIVFKDNTVFIIGAGASAEFGLPVGSSLAPTITRSATCIQSVP